VVNARLFRPPRRHDGAPRRVAVLIPARDEASGIRACLEHVLASRGVDIEVLVLDDNSSDDTAAIVDDVCRTDARVRLLRATVLPPGWNGKQHACWQLAQAVGTPFAASFAAPWMLFLDADVRVQPEAIADCLATICDSRNALLSGFPRQLTHGFLEWLLLPLIHFVLLGFLPLGRMRATTNPAYAAGCGQFMLVEREAYTKAGGHAAIRETRHDGLRLPRLFREHGLHTDMVDLTDHASVRMYDSAAATWNGLAKNATEGLGSPTRIVPFTLLLALGQITPIVLVFGWILLLSVAATGAGMTGAKLWTREVIALTLAVVTALIASYMPRFIAVRRFKQPLKSAWLHPLGVLLLLILQWYALVRQVLGKPVGWRARKYSTASGGELQQDDGRR
jgi:hypothetical protein